MEAVREARAPRSTAVIPALFAVLALALLVVALACAFIPVHVPNLGDTAPYDCTPIEAGCGDHVDGRLRSATFAGMGAAVLGLLAFATERGLEPDRAA